MKRKSSRNYAPGASPKIEKEVRRHLRFLQSLLAESDFSQNKIEEHLGWPQRKLSEIFSGRQRLHYWRFLAILASIGLDLWDFAAKLVPKAGGHRDCGELFTADDFQSASQVLGRVAELRPGTPELAHFYLQRSIELGTLLERVQRAKRLGRRFHALVAGHRGAGVSTEIERLIASRRIDKDHVVVRLDLPKATDALAELIDESVPRTEEDPARHPLLVIEGLAKWKLKHLERWLDKNLRVIERCEFSTILAVPISVLYRPRYGRLVHRSVIVPPVSIYAEVDQADRAAEAGQDFFDDLIRRYLPLDELTDDARASLALLSAGLPGEMIARTRDACRAAAAAGAEKVDKAAVEAVWREQETKWRERLSADGLARLRHIANEPFDDGAEGLAELLHENAVLLQPEHGGWLAVHPALRRMLRENQ